MPDDLRLMLDRMVAGGDCLARDADGRVVFVDGGLPGETVDAVVTETKRDFRRAVAGAVVETSPDRVTSPCRHFTEGCGGCQWQHAAVPAQRNYKVEIIRDSLRRLAGITDPPIQALKAVSSEDYRTTIRAVPDVEGRLQFHRRRSSELLAVPGCIIVNPLVRDVLANGRFPGCGEVTVRATTAERRTIAMTDVDCPQAVVPEHTTVVTHLAVKRQMKRYAQREMVGAQPLRVSPLSFFQSGPQAAELLSRTVASAAARHFGADPISILDLYAGVGLLGIAVMRGRNVSGDRLVAVEDGRLAASDASANTAGLEADVVDVEVSRFRWPENRPPDLVIADPGRPGLGQKVARGLSNLRPGLMVLVSCDPASMARDVKVLGEHGYRLIELFPLDLFPHTSHVEVVSVVRRAAVP